MADEYILKVTLSINGAEITDFKAVREGERVPRAQVNLMNKTGFAKKKVRYTVGLDYVVPASGDEYDWDGLENATLVLEYEGGRRVSYAGVCTLTVGESTVDGDSEMVRPINLGATDRKVE